MITSNVPGNISSDAIAVYVNAPVYDNDTAGQDRDRTTGQYPLLLDKSFVTGDQQLLFVEYYSIDIQPCQHIIITFL